MSREQRIPPRRQFMHPMPSFRDEMPAVPPGMPEPLSPYRSDASFSFAEPDSSSWMMPLMTRQHSSDPFAAPSGRALREDEFQSIPQSEENLEAWQAWTFGELPQTGKDVALSPMIPLALPWQTGRRAAQKRKQKRHKARKKRIPTWLVVTSVIAILVIVLTQGNGTVGAWSADAFRSIAGPVVTAQIEATYLNAQNKVSQLQYQLGWQHINVPWQQAPSIAMSTPPPGATMKPMPLPPMKSFISPPLAGEGTWNELERAPGPYGYLPLDARTFIRPDANYPYAVVSLLQFDARFMRMHIVPGTQEPGGPVRAYGTGTIPKIDQEGNTLLAVLNGGFKYADGAFGLMTDGRVYVPPQPNAGTIAITRAGKLLIGAWGSDPQLNSNNQDLVAWRQNASLLINNGVINPLTKDGAAWGGTILNSEYTWRSGIGVTEQGNLLYAAGNTLLPETLGKALRAAGAVMAIETDINPFWVRAFLYQRTGSGALTITRLNAQMQGTGKEYLNGDQRDFFYLTRYTPPPVH